MAAGQTAPGVCWAALRARFTSHFIGLPIVALLVRAAQQENLWNAVTGDLALTALRLSVITSVVSIAVVVAGGTPFAYLLARSNHWLARVIDGLVELPIVPPARGRRGSDAHGVRAQRPAWWLA